MLSSADNFTFILLHNVSMALDIESAQNWADVNFAFIIMEVWDTFNQTQGLSNTMMRPVSCVTCRGKNIRLLNREEQTPRTCTTRNSLTQGFVHV